MGQTSAETVREIEQTRDRLEGELRMLEDRLPSPAALARRAGVVAGGAAVAVAGLVTVRALMRRREPEPSLPPALRAVTSKLPDSVAQRVTSVRFEDARRALSLAVLGVTLMARIAEWRRARAA